MKLLTIKDLQARWSRSRRQVYTIIAKHDLKAVRLDSRPLFRERDVERVENSRLS